MFLLDKSRITINDLRQVSQASREARLDQELARFEDCLEITLVDKTRFLEDLYRRLQQLTSRWRSWHRGSSSTGGRGTQFISIGQIEELVVWDRTIHTKHRTSTDTSAGDEDKPIDTLIRFLQACKDSQDLYDQFDHNLYRPLNEFFKDEQVKPLAQALVGVMGRWKGLLSPGPINHRLFSAKSADAVYYMDLTCRPRDSQFNLVLRLVPDLSLKAFEAFCLAKQWRSSVGPAGYTRELNYIYSKWIPEKRGADSDFHCKAIGGKSAIKKSFELMTNQERLREVQSKLCATEKVIANSSEHMHDTSSEAHRLSGAIGTTLEQLGSMRQKVKTARFARGEIVRGMGRTKGYIDMLQEEMKREQQEIQRIRARLIQSEISWKYTNNREMTRVLEDDLAESIARCQHLRTEITRAESGYGIQKNRHRSACDRLNDERDGLESIKSERVAISRKLLKSRDKQRVHEKRLVTAADNFNSLKEELRQSKLTQNVLIRQMLQPKQEERPWTKTL